MSKTVRRHRIAGSAAALLVVAALGACGPGATSTGAAGPAEPAAYAEQIIEHTNAARTAHGLPELATCACARDAALGRAKALVGAAELEHADLAPVHAACAPPSGTTAENLSRADAAPAAVVDAWLASPGHANNLLSPDLTEIGVGCVVDDSRGSEELLCSQVFLG